MSVDKEILKSALDIAVTKTMENMAFEEVEETNFEAQEIIKKKEMLWVSIEFIHPKNGAMVLFLSKEAAQLLTESLYDPKDITPAVIQDAMAEILNTIGGCFLQNFLDPEEKFQLGLPVTGKGKLPKLKDLAGQYTYYIGENAVLNIMLAGPDFL